MKKRRRRRPSAGAAKRGRPVTYAPAARAKANAVQAIALLAREGATHRNQLAGLIHPPRKEPEKSAWWGADRLAHEIGLGWNPSSFNRLGTGRYSVEPETAVRYMAAFLCAGLMPPKAFDSWPQLAGQRRAMAPFQALLPSLRCLKAFERPGPELRAQISVAATDYRTLLRNRGKLAKDDRDRVRRARRQVVDRLLKLPTKIYGPDFSDYGEKAVQLATSIANLMSVMNSLRVSTWMLAETPRMFFVNRASQLLPLPNSSGEPDFAKLFGWLASRALVPVPSRKSRLEDLYARVRARWGVDIGPLCAKSEEHPSSAESLQLCEAAFRFDRDDRCIDVADDPRCKDGEPPRIVPRDVPPELPFHNTLGHMASTERTRFSMKVRSPSRPYSVHFLTVMAMAERWFFGDQEPDDPETEFRLRLQRVGDLAAQAARAVSMPPEGAELTLDSPQQWSPWQHREVAKLLVKELMRLDTRPLVEMDLDLPAASDVRG